MAQIADGDILSNAEFKITASRTEHKGSAQRRCQNNIAVDNPLHMFQNRIAMIAGFGKSGILSRAQRDGIRATHSRKPQLVQCLGDSIRIVADVLRKSLDRIAGPLTNSLNARRLVSIEDRAVLGKREDFGSIFDWLPIRVLRPALNIINRRLAR